ncbi:XTP/dITP diphosphohydrolase [Oikeobacillus pervagus]|uniref:dITP/XTP pyrophosphatase n=1 Tax=Oikeobacillus pervagus TaxID=1325931 RepID=A0AAJ1T258_9BACI|nr:XTP/dITP diphosphatase [Oikeobacillus pervagus]MDQ0215422.1 XTP/dITP diphosphohydrolase [Oikeobacillus pervagus]
MDQVIIATKNQGKAKEFIQMFEPFSVQVKTLLDFPEFPDIAETGETFEENAQLKAKAVAESMQSVAIADDSGLIVDALDGRPGVYSARYAGLDKNDEANIDKVLKELQGIPFENRTARFYCALAIAMPNGKVNTVSGACEGYILSERRGESGFGYDPIFYVRHFGKTFAELSPSEKNSISHRGQALKELEKKITTFFEG